MSARLLFRLFEGAVAAIVLFFCWTSIRDIRPLAWVPTELASKGSFLFGDATIRRAGVWCATDRTDAGLRLIRIACLSNMIQRR